MENDPLLTPPSKIWNFPYVSSLFFLKASLRDIDKSGSIHRSSKEGLILEKITIFFWYLTVGGHLTKIKIMVLKCTLSHFKGPYFNIFTQNDVVGGKGKDISRISLHSMGVLLANFVFYP